MANFTSNLNMRVDPSTMRALKEAAEDERRTVSRMVEIVLRDWLEANGYLQPDKKKAALLQAGDSG